MAKHRLYWCLDLLENGMGAGGGFKVKHQSTGAKKSVLEPEKGKPKISFPLDALEQGLWRALKRLELSDGAEWQAVRRTKWETLEVDAEARKAVKDTLQPLGLKVTCVFHGEGFWRAALLRVSVKPVVAVVILWRRTGGQDAGNFYSTWAVEEGDTPSVEEDRRRLEEEIRKREAPVEMPGGYATPDEDHEPRGLTAEEFYNTEGVVLISPEPADDDIEDSNAAHRRKGRGIKREKVDYHPHE
jgi:hypothetical protein